jgi:hypothetical protein
MIALSKEEKRFPSRSVEQMRDALNLTDGGGGRLGLYGETQSLQLQYNYSGDD